MAKKPVAIILGGTAPHINVIEVLKSRGYYTVLIDYYKNPVAKKAADIHIKESTLDTDKVLEIASEFDAELVVGPAVDQANSVACYVAEKLNLKRPYSYATSLEVCDKSLMKAKMISNGIPTSRHAIFDSRNSLDDFIASEEVQKLRFPLVIKPVDNNGSKGVRKLEDPKKLRDYIEYSVSESRSGKAVVEEFVDGDEIQIDCFAADEKAHVIMIRKRLKIAIEEGQAMQSFGSLIPAGASDVLKEKINVIANRIASGFGLKNTPFFFQAIVKGDDISVLEFAPRIGGSLSSYLISTITGFDVISAAVDSCMNVPTKVEYHDNDDLYMTHIMYAYEGTFDHIEGVDELLNEGTIIKFMPSKTKAMKIASSQQMDSRNRVGFYVMKGTSLEDLKSKAAKANERLKVIDDKGNDIMRKDLYFHEA